MFQRLHHVGLWSDERKLLVISASLRVSHVASNGHVYDAVSQFTTVGLTVRVDPVHLNACRLSTRLTPTIKPPSRRIWAVCPTVGCY